MNELAALLTSFDVSILFAVAEQIAKVLATTISPVLLLISIYIRLMETQIDGLTGGGKYGTALRDMMLWTVVLGSYYGLANLVFEFFNPIYVWMDSFGSLAETMKSFANIMAKNKVALDANGLTLTGVITAPFALIAMFLYYLSLVIVAFLSAFLKVANVLILCVAFVWGFIAIPVSISTTFKILKGWGLLLAFALVWPVVQGLMFAMFAMLFKNSADTLLTMSDMDATVKAANIMMLFSVMHLLLAAVMVSAPFIANALVSNTSAAGGIVMPFVAAATAAGVATIKGGQAQGGIPSGGGVSGGTSRVAGSNTNYRTPTARGATAGFTKNNPASLVYSEAQAAAGSVSQPETTAPASRPNPPLLNASGRKQQQQRRGVLARQQQKKGVKT